MNYHHITPASFIKRINRFTAEVLINETIVTVHVKNTGRCRELLLPAASVYLEKALNPNRKTVYDLIAMEEVYEVRANTETDPDFAQALALAKQKGVEIWYLPCKVTADTLCILQDSHQ